MLRRHRFGSIKTLPLILGLCVLAACVLQGQTISDDEIKIATQPYTPVSPNAIRVQSNLVQVDVVVRDSDGKPVGGLKKGDFQVFDNGKQQTISLFEAETSHPQPTQAAMGTTSATSAPTTAEVSAPVHKPRYIGMFFDDKNLPQADLVTSRRAAESLIKNHLEPTDQAAVFTTSTEVTQPFTADKQLLLAALAKINTRLPLNPGGCPRLTPYQAYQITQDHDQYSDALNLALAEAQTTCCTGLPTQQCIELIDLSAEVAVSLQENWARDSLGILGDIIRYVGTMPGKRVLVMSSSGFFSQTDVVQRVRDKMIDSAIRSGVVINTLDAKGLAAEWLGNCPDTDLYCHDGGKADPVSGAMVALAEEFSGDERDVADDVLESLADGTGGTFFHNNNDLTGGLREIAAEPEYSYSLGFSPDVVRDDGSYHTLKVKTPGLHAINVKARPGYFARTKQEDLPTVKYQRLNKEVNLSDTLSELPTELNMTNGVLATGESALKITVHVDGRGLQFKKLGGRHAERLLFVTALFDQAGHYLTGEETVTDMTLKDETKTRIAHEGATARFVLRAPPGVYRLREVVQEVVGGHINAQSQPVEIKPDSGPAAPSHVPVTTAAQF
jgi:VWFA-related protein